MSSNDSSTDKKIIRTIYICVLVLIPLAFGGISLYLGKDINWDLRNYHYYNAYSFLENRLDFDIAPAQLQTYVNPVADIPFYLMVKSFPSWVASFVLGTVHGLNLSFIFLIFWKINNGRHKWKKLTIGIFLVILSGAAPSFISELGNTMHDNLTSLFVLSTVFFLICSLEKTNKGKNTNALNLIKIAGLLMGIGVGIKPSITIFAVSSTAVLVLFQPSWSGKLKRFFLYGTAGLTGGLISAGFWWLEMWKRFQNPFFPFYNHIFKSPYFTITSINWSDFLPQSLWEYLIWPFIIMFNSLRTNQYKFLDIRLALLYSLFLLWLLLIILRTIHVIPATPTKTNFLYSHRLGNFLLLFFLFSYTLWLIESATYRFLIPLELLTPLCILLLLERVIPSNKTQTILATSGMVLMLLLFRPFNWGRLEWSSSYFEVDIRHMEMPKEAIVVMIGRSPMSYIIPEFPEKIRFVRPEGNLFTYKGDDGKIRYRVDDQQIIFTRIKELLNKQQGYFYVLYNKKEPNIDVSESLLYLGLTPNIEECFLIDINTPDILEMCRVAR